MYSNLVGHEGTIGANYMSGSIVVTEPFDFTPEQIQRLEKIAEAKGTELTISKKHPTRDEWVELVAPSSFVLTGKRGFSDRDESGEAGTEAIYSAPEGTVISHPFVNVGWVDKAKLAEKDITLTYAPGCNRDAVAEWTLSCALDIFRGFSLAKNKEEVEPRITRTESLLGKNITILGKGAVGTRVGELAEAFKMNVSYLTRENTLEEAVKGADLVVNCLSSKPENHDLLDAEFFNSTMPKGAVFICMTNPMIYSIEGLLAALGNGHLSGAGIDVGSSFPGDTTHENYQKFMTFLDSNPEYRARLLVTPQVAHFSDESQKVSFDMAIENLECAVRGELEAVEKRTWK